MLDLAQDKHDVGQDTDEIAGTKTFLHTFKDSGVVVRARKVSPFIMVEARNEALRAKPKPPVRVVTEEGPLFGTEEVMDKDPEYLARVQKWDRHTEALLSQLQTRRAVVEIVKPVDWQAWCLDFRIEREATDRFYAEINPEYLPRILPPDDLTLFVLYAAAATNEDLQEFAEAISKRSYPTAEVVGEVAASFHADVSP